MSMHASHPYRTGFFTHPDCVQHEMGRGHPECPERLTAIEAKMQSSGLNQWVHRRTADWADLSAIERAHSASHVQMVQDMAQALAREMQSDSGTAAGDVYLALDPDTSMNPFTWSASLAASGAVLAAVDAVMAGAAAGGVDNAFCAVRPPGHHATRSRAMGFCVFNQVAVGVKHALEVHGLTRVAVVDFDVHHGNGTEDILGGDERVMMCGIFQHPFYPYSGEQPAASNMHNLPIAARTSGQDICRQIEATWLPELDAFKPEIIFISAGFDAHRDDDLGQLGMLEADYVWITQRLMEIANRHAQGRIVSSLEGGYNLNALANSAAAHVATLAGVTR